ncbi:hypothetical protein T07_15092 [Trichinella nelsoni]|uniref:Uncharacterized protein n=1 Tax=Trichinella nelsoni TaxID=6336 RepID=A0A0V0S6C0_9BILA|nr:hypothetical protein T07_15092 [Trichinella nelsoni]
MLHPITKQFFSKNCNFLLPLHCENLRYRIYPFSYKQPNEKTKGFSEDDFGRRLFFSFIIKGKTTNQLKSKL